MNDAPSHILVTGATGNTGIETLRSLASLAIDKPYGAVQIRAAVRNPETYKAPSDLVEAVRFDFLDRSSWKPALSGVNAVFLVRPPAISDIDATLGPFIDHVANRGIKKIVFLSLQGVESMPYVPHYKVEERIRSDGIPFIFLRPSFFMQNLSTTHRKEIAHDDVIFVPAGRGKTNFIDVRDIGDVAAKVLLEAGHEGKSYELTGAECLDYYQIAAILSEVLERPIRYSRPSSIRFLVRALRQGTPLNFALVQTGIYLAAALGKAARTTDAFENLMGRKARDFRSFSLDMKKEWAKA